MPRSHPAVLALPFLPALAGLALGIWRFEADDPLVATALVLGGVLGMVVVALRVSAPSRP